MDLERVLSPITLGRHCHVKNRVVRTGHGTNIGEGRVSPDLIAYHEARARGGVGLTILEAASVHRTDTGTLRLHDASCVDDYQALMATLAPYDMRVFQQLGHLGYAAVPMDEGPPWSASALAAPNTGIVAHAMDGDEIAEIVDAFAQAAAWGAAGGLDGVEVHAAHGYLLEEFLSPATNQRTDAYGGDLDGRMRLTLEIVAAVRAAVGPDLVVGVRIGPEAVDDGLDELDVAEIVRRLEATGQLDYVNVTYGSCRTPHKIIGAMHEPVGYELPTSVVVTKATTLPTIVTGRFRTLAEADEVIASGAADLVGMTRAHIADPEIVAKTLAGRTDRIRPCVACNQGCVGGLHIGRMACAVNADVGFERLRVHAYEPAARPRRVLVVGGGPAGMEAARVAAVRGHRVTLVEARPKLGGSMVPAAAAPYRSTLGDIVGWFERELREVGVEVVTGRLADRAFIEGVHPDAVVVATGATEHFDLPSAPTGPERRTGAEVLRLAADGKPLPPAPYVVVDRSGTYEAIGVAEVLAAAGPTTLVSRTRLLAPLAMVELVVVPATERLRAADVTIHLGVDASEVVENGLVLADGRLVPAATVVVVERVPTPLVLDGVAAEVVTVGDAVDASNLWHAVRTGNAAARAL